MEMTLLKKEEMLGADSSPQYLFTLGWGNPEKGERSSACVLPVDEKTYSRFKIGEKVRPQFE